MDRQSVIDSFKAWLRVHGLKYTREREAILSEVIARSGHFDAEEFAAHMRSTGLKCSRATVYRTLDILDELGVVHKSTLGHKHQHYESMVDRPHHDHLICLGCDKVVEFVDDNIERLQIEACQRLGFTINRHSLQIFGHCPDCQKKG
ncbi:MAG: hypothetical protein RL095_1551 [Verrucomicrobiota bacterium]|jgi:Fur family ferric uptake transcriptional regulator